DIVQKLLKQKLVDINAYFNGVTGLHRACIRGHSHLVHYLLSYPQLNVNVVTTTEHSVPELTPLYSAVTPTNLAVLTNPIAKTEDDQSNRIDIAEMLINHGANINSINYMNLTPLHKAILHNELDMVKFLVMRGADLSISVRIDDK